MSEGSNPAIESSLSCRSDPRLLDRGNRILLINPPVYDIRLPWAKWQQPDSLLRLAAHYSGMGAHVRLIDAMYRESNQRLKRKRVALLDTDGERSPKWRFGRTVFSIASELRDLGKLGWKPDTIFVEGFATFWWEGAAEVVALAKERFPESRIVLIGAYPALAPEHARAHTVADEIVGSALGCLTQHEALLSIYPASPRFCYLSLRGRAPEKIVDEVAAKAQRRAVQHFAFIDELLGEGQVSDYAAVLEGIISRKLRVCLYALGNIRPSLLASHPELPSLMKRAGYNQICFADDRDVDSGKHAGDAVLDSYAHAIPLCHQAGFRPRSDDVVASISVGRTGDDLMERSQTLTMLAHVAGSVIVWPYQPAPDECPDLALEAQNGKLFPLRERNGASYRDYLGILGLAVVLSSKYRTKTFDFLGPGLIPQLFRGSLARRAWDPDPAVKGTLHLPVLASR